MAKRVAHKILVVDDDRFMRRLCMDALSKAGYDVECARNGLEALEMMCENPYDLIISDVEMPRLDGPGLYERAVREFSHLRGRFIFMSGTGSEGVKARLGEKAPYLLKPFKVPSLIESVGSVLGPLVDGADGAIQRRREERSRRELRCLLAMGGLKDHIDSMTVDLSMGGLRVRHQGVPLKPASRLKVRIDALGLETRAEIIWSRSLNESESVAGLRLLEPAELPAASHP